MQKSNTQLSANVVKRFMVDSRARLIGLLGAAAVAGLSLATLLPTHWVPRTGLGWENEHFIVYFTTTIILSLASRKPYVVAIGLTTFAGVLEACQGLTPDRFPDLTRTEWRGRRHVCCHLGDPRRLGKESTADTGLLQRLSPMASVFPGR